MGVWERFHLPNMDGFIWGGAVSFEKIIYFFVDGSGALLRILSTVFYFKRPNCDTTRTKKQ